MARRGATKSRRGKKIKGEERCAVSRYVHIPRIGAGLIEVPAKISVPLQVLVVVQIFSPTPLGFAVGACPGRDGGMDIGQLSAAITPWMPRSWVARQQES